MYELQFTSKAKRDLEKFSKSEPKSFDKVTDFLSQLRNDPRKGTGKPERLKGKNSYKL